jgi:phosphoenolpyruvate carboxylase
MAINQSVRSLYKILGDIVGKQVFDRLINDSHLNPDLAERKRLAYQYLNSISDIRKILNSDKRNFGEVRQHFDILSKAGNKLIAWVLEAYLLLNQSSTTAAEVTNTVDSSKVFAHNLISTLESMGLNKSQIEAVFTERVSANLVLTAHPTAGIQPDYMHHISNMVEKVQEIAEVLREGKSTLEIEHKIESIQEALKISISHMVRVKPYNEKQLKPFDESKNFLFSVNKIYDIIPEKLVGIESYLKSYLKKSEFILNNDFFRLHSWVARDIDGNPTVSPNEHFAALINESIYFAKRYINDIRKLWQTLSDDFTDNPELPAKTFFRDEQFKALYNKNLENYSGDNSHQAYRVVLEAEVLKPLEKLIGDLVELAGVKYTKLDHKKLSVFDQFSIYEDIVNTFSAIKANKENVNTREIDILIKKLEVFGAHGSFGHTRQGSSIIEKLVSDIYAKQNFSSLADKTKYVLENKANFKELASEHQSLIETYKADDTKDNFKAKQTLELLRLHKLGGLRRQIISMNRDAEDMLNALLLLYSFNTFKCAETVTDPTTGQIYFIGLPESHFQIVPLTEQIIDLRNSYLCTIETLKNPDWRQYLIANNGEYIKMRGPSDSGKQNGFMASQWEMFHSKQLDTIVIDIFNAYLKKALFNVGDELEAWKKVETESAIETKVIKTALKEFKEVFKDFELEKSLWLLAYDKKKFSQLRLVNFDGWGEPIERGGGLEFKHTATATQPLGSQAKYERTLQGGGAQQLGSLFRSEHIVSDFISGVTELAGRNVALADLSFNKNLYLMSANFIDRQNEMIAILRKKLRFEIIGLDLEDDLKCSDESVLRNYFSHVIKSPLIYLDFFNIASRPTSRSGTKIKEFLADESFDNNLDKLAQGLDINEILQILADVRAIPYSAMFSLLGGNHVSFYGFDGLLAKPDLIEFIQDQYHRRLENSESRLIKHMIDSLERGVFTADPEAYQCAHTLIAHTLNSSYDSSKDTLMQRIISGNQVTRNFVAKIKDYTVANPDKVRLEDLMQTCPEERALLIARRNDAAVPRMGIAYSMSRILENCRYRGLNPLEIDSISLPNLDLLRKAFAAGASTFGNGCID